jgi:hypothetical protein
MGVADRLRGSSAAESERTSDTSTPPLTRQPSTGVSRKLLEPSARLVQPLVGAIKSGLRAVGALSPRVMPNGAQRSRVDVEGDAVGASSMASVIRRASDAAGLDLTRNEERRRQQARQRAGQRVARVLKAMAERSRRSIRLQKSRKSGRALDHTHGEASGHTGARRVSSHEKGFVTGTNNGWSTVAPLASYNEPYIDPRSSSALLSRGSFSDASSRRRDADAPSHRVSSAESSAHSRGSGDARDSSAESSTHMAKPKRASTAGKRRSAAKHAQSST